MKRHLVIILAFVLSIGIIGCSESEKVEQKVEKVEPVVVEEQRDEEVEEPVEVVIEDEEPIEEEEQPDFKTEAELNSEEYPAGPGRSLVTKGNNNFTGMKYYFKGEIIALSTIDNIGDPNVWLVKNEKGYVMPIQYDTFEATEGDEVEIWGTLSGNGYAKVEGIDNVVGETGSMHIVFLKVNGEEQF